MSRRDIPYKNNDLRTIAEHGDDADTDSAVPLLSAVSTYLMNTVNACHCCRVKNKNSRHRKKIGGKLANQVFHRACNPHGVGNCWHCGKPLGLSLRKNIRTVPSRSLAACCDEGGVGVAWHVDHWPVPYREIKDQIGIGIGVSDELDISNLVPACVSCNTSRKHEVKKWYLGGRAQFPVTGASVSSIIFISAAATFIMYWWRGC